MKSFKDPAGEIYYLPEKISTNNNIIKAWCPDCNAINLMDSGFRYWDYVGFKCHNCKKIFIYPGYDEFEIEEWKEGNGLLDIADGETLEEYFEL